MMSVATMRRATVDAARVAEMYRSLTERPDTYIQPDGRALAATCLGGTLPIVFRGRQYFIPVEVWLLDSYPESAPIIHVRPTRDMALTPFHTAVDRAGLCTTDRLRRWSPTCDLLEVLRDLQRRFGEAPPVYTRSKTEGPDSVAADSLATSGPLPPAGSVPTSNPASSAPHSHSPVATVATTTTLLGSSQEAETAGGEEGPAGPAAGTTHEGAAALQRLNMVAVAAAKELENTIAHDMVQFGTLEQALLRNQALLQRGLEQARADRREAEEALASYRRRREAVEAWVADVDALALPAAELYSPADPVAEVALRRIADDAAIEDCLYYTQQALYRGLLDAPSFLREVRRLSREQGLHRAELARLSTLNSPS